MSQKPGISVQNTTQFLQNKFDENVCDVVLLSGGEWSQAYSFVWRGKKYVLRWSESSENFERDAYAVNFSSEAMPVPKVTEMGKTFEKYYAITEFVQGEFIEKLSARELKQALPSLFSLFDALRTADLTATTGFGSWDKYGNAKLGSWKEHLLGVNQDAQGSLTYGWYEHLKNSTMGTKVFDQLYAKLEEHIHACPEVRELIHSDLLNFNLLASDDKICAVIDWGCSLYGDALYDIVWFLYYAPWYPQFKEIGLCEKLLTQYETHAKEVKNIQERVFCYKLHIGLGSIAYNAFKQDWNMAQETAEYTVKVCMEK